MKPHCFSVHCRNRTWTQCCHGWIMTQFRCCLVWWSLWPFFVRQAYLTGWLCWWGLTLLTKSCLRVKNYAVNTGITLVNWLWTTSSIRFFSPSAIRAGGVLSRFGRAGGWAGGCQTCGTHISVTAWRIFSIWSSVELSRPVGVHCHGHMPICPIWTCPWAKNLWNLPQIGSRLCGTHISEIAGWIYPI